MIWYILLFGSAIGSAINFAITKAYQLEQGNTLYTGAVFNCMVGLVGFLIYFAVCQFKIEITLFSLVLSALFTLFVGTYTIIGFKIMSMGNMTVYTVFLMLGGMILPYFYGVIFLNEHIRYTKIIALILLVAAIIMQEASDGKKGRRVFYLLCILVFILNGATSIVSKMHQIDSIYSTVSENGFVMLKNAERFLIFGIMIPFVKRDDKKRFSIKPKTCLLIAFSALASSIAYMLLLLCASHLPATVQFPVMTGGTIIFTALLATVIYKEKINKKQAFGLMLCLIATIIFVI